MTDEIYLQWIVVGNLFMLMLSATAYGFGGLTNGRVLRRVVSPLLIFLSLVVTSLLLHSWSWIILGTVPLLVLRNTLGYGGDNVGMRLLKRGLIAALSILTGVVLVFAFQVSWWLVAIHAVVVLPTLFFSFKNPIIARMEEPLICILLNLPILCYPFVSV